MPWSRIALAAALGVVVQCALFATYAFVMHEPGPDSRFPAEVFAVIIIVPLICALMLRAIPAGTRLTYIILTMIITNIVGAIGGLAVMHILLD